VAENENKIKGIALILAFLLIAPFSFQSLILLPKILWLTSQFSSFFDDLAKNQTDTSINGVVGIIGNNRPIKPRTRNNNPKNM